MIFHIKVALHKYCRNLYVLMGLLIAFNSIGQEQLSKHKTGMLILGSANLNTTKERAKLGVELFESNINFDYIIVSGGCGAHGSAICEASEMKSFLIQKGVPENIIFKEEKSHSTVQNYCYSRMLEKPDGTKLINKGDTVYVVSNHWHAISVAGCLSEKDLVTAKYHIEGNILPKKTDKVDYTRIFQECSNNENYCSAKLWPKPDASYFMETAVNQGKKVFLIKGLHFQKETLSGSEYVINKMAEAKMDFPQGWNSNIDAAFYNKKENKVYYLKDKEYIRFTPNAKKIDDGYPKLIQDWIKGIPDNWYGGFVDAAFFDPQKNRVYLFKEDQYLVFAPTRGIEKIGKINEFVANWPFSWGSGNIDAASFNNNEKKVYLYRGKEKIMFILDDSLKIEQGFPKKSILPWPSKFLGNKI